MSVIIQGLAKFKNVITQIVDDLFTESGTPLQDESGETLTLN